MQFYNFLYSNSIIVLKLNKEQNVQVCDATGDDSNNAAGYITLLIVPNNPAKIHGLLPLAKQHGKKGLVEK